MPGSGAAKGGQNQDFDEEYDQVRDAGMRGAFGKRAGPPEESERDRVTHQPIDAQTQEASPQTDLMFHTGEPTDDAGCLQNLHDCNSPVMPNALGSLRVYPDRLPSKVKARVNLADVTIRPYSRKIRRYEELA